MLTRTRDHPRSRGVYSLSTIAPSVRNGSSPLARGLLSSSFSFSCVGGIIPARAGFTSGRQCPTIGTWDHPRSRGVYTAITAATPARWGSSPLARGLLIIDVTNWSRGRIIPARAGFTPAGAFRHDEVGDHPRSRGVYEGAEKAPTSGEGSSPLARGLPSNPEQKHSRPWIIPARAGFTPPTMLRAHPYRDHPRSRGVYWCVFTMCHCVVGSSPLARGLLCSFVLVLLTARIIPARAGFTGE